MPEHSAKLYLHLYPKRFDALLGCLKFANEHKPDGILRQVQQKVLLPTETHIFRSVSELDLLAGYCFKDIYGYGVSEEKLMEAAPLVRSVD